MAPESLTAEPEVVVAEASLKVKDPKLPKLIELPFSSKSSTIPGPLGVGAAERANAALVAEGVGDWFAGGDVQWI